MGINSFHTLLLIALLLGCQAPPTHSVELIDQFNIGLPSNQDYLKDFHLGQASSAAIIEAHFSDSLFPPNTSRVFDSIAFYPLQTYAVNIGTGDANPLNIYLLVVGQEADYLLLPYNVFALHYYEQPDKWKNELSAPQQRETLSNGYFCYRSLSLQDEEQQLFHDYSSLPLIRQLNRCFLQEDVSSLDINAFFLYYLNFGQTTRSELGPAFERSSSLPTGLPKPNLNQYYLSYFKQHPTYALGEIGYSLHFLMEKAMDGQEKIIGFYLSFPRKVNSWGPLVF